MSFPAGKHDDQVDALGLVGQLLDQMVPGQRPKQPEKHPTVDSGYRPIGLDERPLDWLVFQSATLFGGTVVGGLSDDKSNCQ